MNKEKLKGLIQTCALCQKHIDDLDKGYAMKAKFRPGVDSKDATKHGFVWHGNLKIIEFRLTTINKTTWAIIPDENSEVKKEGYDFLFLLCSNECREKFRAILKEEKAIFDAVYSQIN